jgi:hypothetical protein
MDGFEWNEFVLNVVSTVVLRISPHANLKLITSLEIRNLKQLDLFLRQA